MKLAAGLSVVVAYIIFVRGREKPGERVRMRIGRESTVRVWRITDFTRMMCVN